MNIKIQKYTQNFGHIVPTEPLLKSALEIHKYEDAKVLNQAIGIKYSGHVSFYKRAIKIAQDIIEKNPQVKDIVEKLKLMDLEQQLREINNIKSSVGENIDVIVK